MSALVAAQFPDLAGQRIGEGSALAGITSCCCAGRQWIFRFPRRAERVPWLLREIEITAICAETLPAAIPIFEKIGEPSRAFPLSLRGLPEVAGCGRRPQPRARSAGLAADIGSLFSALHSIGPSRIPPTPDGWEHAPWGELRTGLTAAAGLARPLLGPDLLAQAEPYLAGQVREPPEDGPRRFIHYDICPDHLIVDPDTGRLNGLIDFTDAMTGDPVLDFTGLIGLGGYAFIDQVAASYHLPLGSGFDARLGWLARVLTLTWLADAAVSDPASISKHLSWVAQAFTRLPHADQRTRAVSG